MVEDGDVAEGITDWNMMHPCMLFISFLSESHERTAYRTETRVSTYSHRLKYAGSWILQCVLVIL